MENSEIRKGTILGVAKIQVKYVWYRLRFPGPQRHILTQNTLEDSVAFELKCIIRRSEGRMRNYKASVV